MLKKTLPFLLAIPSVGFASGAKIDFLNFDSQTQFQDFAKDLTGALSTKTLEPAEPLGLPGFDIGISYNMSNLKNDSMDHVSNNGGKSIDTITLHAVKGLPSDLNFGLDYSQALNSNIQVWGAKLSYALIEGGTLYPAVNISANYTQTTGIDALTFNGYGAEVGVSKGFANFTPYASLGMVTGNVKAREDNTGAAGPDLQDETVSMPKAAIGVNINLLVMDVLVAFNQIGEVSTYSIKAGYRF